MIIKLFRVLFHVVFYVLIFVGLVWALLGISPSETYVRSRDSLSRFLTQTNVFTGKVFQTGENMKNVADFQLQQASDRFHGKDPYEKINRQLSEDMKKI